MVGCLRAVIYDDMAVTFDGDNLSDKWSGVRYNACSLADDRCAECAQHRDAVSQMSALAVPRVGDMPSH